MEKVDLGHKDCFGGKVTKITLSENEDFFEKENAAYFKVIILLSGEGLVIPTNGNKKSGYLKRGGNRSIIMGGERDFTISNMSSNKLSLLIIQGREC